MTEAMVSQAQVAAPGVDFEGWTSHDGPPAIQGAEDGAAATPPLLDLVKQASATGAEGIVIGCFDDTALEEAARLALCPVIGLGQASYHYAVLRNMRFSVVTTLPVSVPILSANIHRQGLGPFLAKVRASNVPVLELEANPERAGQTVLEEARQAQKEDDIATVILGCAGMVQIIDSVERALTIDVVDPVACAARCMKWLI